MKKIIFIYLIIFAQCLYSQEKNVRTVEILPDALAEFTSDDVYNRFDNGYYNLGNLKKFEVEKTATEIILKCVNSGGSYGYSIKIHLAKDLTITKAIFNESGCLFQNSTEITNVNLVLNQNPFESIEGLQGQFELNFDKSSIKIINSEHGTKRHLFHGKFKRFSDEEVFDIHDKNQSKIRKNTYLSNTDSYQFTAIDGIYLNPEKEPVLKNLPKLEKEITALNVTVTRSLVFYFRLDKDGAINEFHIPWTTIKSKEERGKVAKLLSDFKFEYTYAYNEGKTVPYQGMIRLKVK